MLLIVHGGDRARLFGTPPVVESTCHGLPESDPDEPVTFWNVVNVGAQETLGFQEVEVVARATSGG